MWPYGNDMAVETRGHRTGCRGTIVKCGVFVCDIGVRYEGLARY